MNTFASADTIATATVAPSFLVHRTCTEPGYCHLTLEDGEGLVGNWVLTQELGKSPSHDMLVVLIPNDGCQGRHEWVEEGQVRGVARHRRKAARPSELRDGLEQGMLQLYFNGRFLNGYYQLRRLPEGSGQLWQLSRLT